MNKNHIRDSICQLLCKHLALIFLVCTNSVFAIGGDETKSLQQQRYERQIKREVEAIDRQGHKLSHTYSEQLTRMLPALRISKIRFPHLYSDLYQEFTTEEGKDRLTQFIFILSNIFEGSPNEISKYIKMYIIFDLSKTKCQAFF